MVSHLHNDYQPIGEIIVFIILLKFTANKTQAGEFMSVHNAWVKRGFDDGVFLLVGSLQPGLGGSIIAQAESLAAICQRVDQDPFVMENIVTAEILELEPKQADTRLQFLVA